MNDNNPYASPQSKVLTPAPSNSEEVRSIHLRYEAYVKALGALYYLNVIGFAFVTFVLIAGIVLQDIELIGAFVGSPVVWALGLSVLTVGIFLLGRGLRGLKSWTRIPAIVIAVIGLLVFPVGTLINGGFLYLLFSKKGQFVFTPEYHAVMAETPHIKYRTSKVAWVALVVIIVLFLIAVYSASSL